ncbi:hypothetical protein Y032_0535g3090 [Ancylostoma ceylanicum]|uniref:Uncharacterized protein n=1 Tax=Ancylostoma ceylanicum TaxID=53326 RepID=A0A016WRP3_9BILA|nr:hypothetical protein Y032_0535g3090 [Ancylostoma ceylanicum]
MRSNVAVCQPWTGSTRDHDQGTVGRGVHQTTRVPRRFAALVRMQQAVCGSLYVSSHKALMPPILVSIIY